MKNSKSLLYKHSLKNLFYSSILLVMLSVVLCSCKGDLSGNQESTSSGPAEETTKEGEEKKDSKKSPDGRLSVDIYSLGEGEPKYRITIRDNEQRKPIFSREFDIDEADRSMPLNDLVKIEAIFNNVVYLSQKKQGQQSTFFIHPESGKLVYLDCAGFDEGYTIKNLTTSSYECSGVIAEKLTSKIIDLPSWSAIESPLESGDSQTIEKEGVKVNLTNFDKSKNQTTLGSRSLLTVDKGGEVIFKKSFSGKCTDCRQVNQEHWKESLRIEDVQADLILLTQFLVEVDDSGKPLNPEQLKSSILVNTKTRKVTHLDCGGNDESYAAKLKEGSYICKVEGLIREEVEKPLPK